MQWIRPYLYQIGKYGNTDCNFHCEFILRLLLRRLVNSTLIPCLHTDNFDLPVQIAVALLTSSPMLKWESPVRRQYLPPYAREAQSFALFPIGKWHGGCGEVCSLKIVFISSFVESFSIVKGDFCDGVDRTSSGF